MKKISRLATTVSSLFISSALIVGLVTTASFPKHKGFGYHGKINALKLDSNKDDALTADASFIEQRPLVFHILDTARAESAEANAEAEESSGSLKFSVHS